MGAVLYTFLVIAAVVFATIGVLGLGYWFLLQLASQWRH